MSGSTFRKNPKVDLKRKYPRLLELSLLISLLMLSLLFFSFQRFDSGKAFGAVPSPHMFKVIEIPRTIQRKTPPPPAIPTIPNPTDDPEALDDVTIDYEDYIQTEQFVNAPPPEFDEPEVYEYFAVSKKPELLNYAAPDYPPTALRAGIEGKVVVKVLVSEKGDVERVELVQSVPMLDETALDAAKKLKWDPAKQRDRYVKVWVSVPYDFRIRN